MGERLALLMLIAAVGGCADTGALAKAGSYGGANRADGSAGGMVPRLRYRSGPVCVCSTGLSETDIQRAQGGGLVRIDEVGIASTTGPNKTKNDVEGAMQWE